MMIPVKGRLVGSARQPVASANGHIGIAKRLKAVAGNISQRPITLDTYHFLRQPRENGGLVTGAGPDFEHAVLGPDF
jgi:hypothetical protein